MISYDVIEHGSHSCCARAAGARSMTDAIVKQASERNMDSLDSALPARPPIMPQRGPPAHRRPERAAPTG